MSSLFLIHTSWIELLRGEAGKVKSHPLFAFLPVVRKKIKNKRVTGLSFTARIERPFSISII